MGLIYVVTLVVLCVVAIGARAARRAVAIAASAWLLVGVGLAILPWMLFALAGWEDAVGQQRLVQHRWNLADPRFYAWNAVLEWRRYISVGRGLQFGIPGAWLLAVCSVTGAAALAFGPWRTDVRQRMIGAALLTGFTMLTLGERDKFFFYLAALWPWIALTVAIGTMIAARSTSRLVRIGALALVGLGCVDGVRAEVQLARRAAARTSYAVMCERLASHLPRDTRLAALPTWWLGLAPRVRDYRSFIVPMLFLSASRRRGGNDLHGAARRARCGCRPARSSDDRLYPRSARERVHGPGVRNPGAEDLERFLDARTVRRIDLADASYGRFEIRFLRPAAQSGQEPTR